MRDTDALDNLIPEITEWRRDIHQNPELGYDVHRTAAMVAEKLREFGVDEVVEGVGRTGVVGVIKGRAAGRTVGMRADMDALPIVEASGAEWSSTVTGKMHACGHDGHTAMLLGAARALADSRDFDGNVVVVFQPAEEGGAGGKAMVDDGMMDRFGIDEIYGMHNMPGMPVGDFALRPGPLMACADQFDITIEGLGGHAAMPDMCIDTVVVASQLVLALQSIVSRNVQPTAPMVVSVTSVDTGEASYNVIPQVVHIMGTLRAYEEDVRLMGKRRLHEIVEHTVAAYGASAKVVYDDGYPATVNDAEKAEFCAKVARTVVGDARVDDDRTPTMGAEDFSYMLNERPGAFIFVGNGDSAALHHPEYDFNDDAIRNGCRYWLSLVDHALGSQRA